MLNTVNLLNLERTIAAELFSREQRPYMVLPKIKDYIIELQQSLEKSEFIINGDVYIHKSASVAPSASISGPCIIDSGAEIRHCAFIRSNAIVGKNCVVGNSTELKNVVLFDCVQVPHYNYVGDSLLGYKAHMGAGSITSNVKSDKTDVTVRLKNEKLKTGMRKFGAILGDFVEVGCNSVLNPGTVIGRNTVIYPLSRVRGYVPADSIYKNENDIVEKN